MHEAGHIDSWPPGPTGSPIFGSIRDLRADLLGWLERCAASYGDFVPIRLGLRQGFLVCDLDVIADVLVRRQGDFRKVHLLSDNRLFLGRGLLTSEGESWCRQRRRLQPMFHADRVSTYAEIIVDETSRVAECWRDGRIRDMQDEMARLTLTILLRCFFGADAKLCEEDVRRIGNTINIAQQRMKERSASLVHLPDTVWTPRNIRLRRAIHIMDEIIYRMIAARRKHGANTPDLLSTLMAASDTDGKRMSDREVRDEAVTMLFAGHETTGLTLSWAWFLLSQHPAEAARIRAEIAMIAGSSPLNAAHVPHLRVVGQVVKEVQRLYPPVYAYGREAVVDVIVGRYRLPAGASVIIAPWVLHRQSRFFPDPLRFRPERWTDDFEPRLPHFAYCPFGGGPRQCIGKGLAMLESVLILAMLARNYDPQLCSSRAIELWPAFTLRSRYGLPMAVNRLQPVRE